MLLFILAVGLAVTLGLMNFINLAHGAFARAGGYITVLLMNRAGVPFLACLPLALLGTALLGVRAGLQLEGEHPGRLGAGRTVRLDGQSPALAIAQLDPERHRQPGGGAGEPDPDVERRPVHRYVDDPHRTVVRHERHPRDRDPLLVDPEERVGLHG